MRTLMVGFEHPRQAVWSDLVGKLAPSSLEFLSADDPSYDAKNVNTTIAVTCAIIGAFVNALGYVAQKHNYNYGDSGLW